MPILSTHLITIHKACNRCETFDSIHYYYLARENFNYTKNSIAGKTEKETNYENRIFYRQPKSHIHEITTSITDQLRSDNTNFK